MDITKCGTCQEPFEDEARFCGTCGTQRPDAITLAPWPRVSEEGPADGRQGRVPAGSGPFFGHSQVEPPGPPSNATRYLCAAAYLDRAFANRVIAELLGSHRAVVPSLDFDLGLIIRHCLTARRAALARDLTLVGLIAVGLFLSLVSTILVLALAFVLGMLPRARWGNRRLGGKLMAGAGVIAALAVVAFIALYEVARSIFQTPELGGSAPPGGLNIAVVIGLIVLAVAIQIGYYYSRYRMLAERLRPGARPVRFSPSNGRAEARIAQIEAAQHGNVTLYGGENPFIGTGSRAGRVWSIAIELDRARTERHGLVSKPGSYVPIDPVELHRSIRDQMLKLKDPSLPANERIAALTMDDHVVGEGRRRWDSPLIDQVRKIPYSQASHEAIEALVHHPQALRHYQRVSVNDTGTPVMSGDLEVIDAVDQGIVVSSFVHLAVEGRMFYLEFVTMVLPPIQRRFKVIDQLPVMSSGSFLGKVIIDALSSLFSDVLHAPGGVYRTLSLMLAEQRSFDQEAAAAADILMADLGALCSVRELGASGRPNTHIQELDASKYTKIIERRLADIVLDFLASKGADVSAFQSGMSTIINNGTVVSGNTFSGPAAIGHAAVATQSFVQAQAQPHAG